MTLQEVESRGFRILTSVVLFGNVGGDVGLFKGPPLEVLLVATTVYVSFLALLASRFLLIAF